MDMSNAEAFQRVVNAELGDGDGIELQIYFDQVGILDEILLHEGDSVEALNAELVRFHILDDSDKLRSMRLFVCMDIARDDPIELPELATEPIPASEQSPAIPQ
jgi:hypothetical protein